MPVPRLKPSVPVAGVVAAASAPSSTVATRTTTAAAAAAIRTGFAAAVSDEEGQDSAEGVSLAWETLTEAEEPSARFPYGVKRSSFLFSFYDF